MRKAIIISAPSGAGKTTIVRHLMQDKTLNLMFSVSATSRKPRPKETDGIDYYFITPDQFKMKIENDEFVEWQEVYENQFYGTLKQEVERVWKLNKNIIFDVDVKGALNLKKYFGDKALSIFIKPPSIEELKNRLIKRKTETPESLEKRLKKAEYELSFADRFDLIIINDDLQTAVNQTIIAVRSFLQKK